MNLARAKPAQAGNRRLTRRHLVAGILLLSTMIPSAWARDGAGASSAALPLHATPRPLPDIPFEDGHGAKRHLADFRGRVVLLNLWATWCAPCRAEMPTLDRLQARLGGKDFEVVALSLDQDGAPVVKRFFDEIGVHDLAIYVDREMNAQGALDAVGVPTTLLIDREGREVARKLGPAVWDSPDVTAVIRELIARPAPQSRNRSKGAPS